MKKLDRVDLKFILSWDLTAFTDDANTVESVVYDNDDKNGFLLYFEFKKSKDYTEGEIIEYITERIKYYLDDDDVDMETYFLDGGIEYNHSKLIIKVN